MMQLVIKLLTEDNIPMSCAAHAAVIPNCDSTNFGANTTKPLTSKPNNQKKLNVFYDMQFTQKANKVVSSLMGFNKNYMAANFSN